MTDLGECKISKQNYCQGKNSGGHPGTILSIDTRFCAKRTTAQVNRERLFYEKVWADNSEFAWLRFALPKYKGLCHHNQSLYSVLQNLKAGMDSPKELDIKLGKASASKQELKDKASLISAVVKKNRHKVLDRVTISHLFGFRVEGVSGWRGSKIELMRTEPEIVWGKYFSSEAVRLQVLAQLRRIIKAVDAHQHQLYMMGSSILIVHDPDTEKVVVKLIDFEHCEIGQVTKTQGQQNKIMVRYLNGLKALYFSMLRFQIV